MAALLAWLGGDLAFWLATGTWVRVLRLSGLIAGGIVVYFGVLVAARRAGQAVPVAAACRSGFSRTRGVGLKPDLRGIPPIMPGIR